MCCRCSAQSCPALTKSSMYPRPATVTAAPHWHGATPTRLMVHLALNEVDEEHLELIRQVGMRSAMAVPITPAPITPAASSAVQVVYRAHVGSDAALSRSARAEAGLLSQPGLVQHYLSHHAMCCRPACIESKMRGMSANHDVRLRHRSYKPQRLQSNLIALSVLITLPDLTQELTARN